MFPTNAGKALVDIHVSGIRIEPCIAVRFPIFLFCSCGNIYRLNSVLYLQIGTVRNQPDWRTTLTEIYVDVTIRNPADRQRSWTGKFLVDTSAFDSLVPRVRLEEIGLEPRGSRDYVLANGNSVALDITIAEIEFEGEIVGGTIVYGEEGAEPFLGVTALESGGFEVDPRNEKLKRLPAVLLKASISQGFVHRSGRARGHRPYDDMSRMVLFAAILKGTDNMNDDKNGFMGGFIRGFCIVFFGGLIILVILIVIVLAL